MRFALIALTTLLLSGCQHQWVGKQAKPHHYLNPQGHETIEYKKYFNLDYDYKIIGDEIHVAGVLVCKEDAEMKAWDHSEIKLFFLFLDDKGVVQEVERMSITTSQLCSENTFKRSFPYKQNYRSVRVTWSFRAQA